MKKTAFTLIELIVVIVILLILTTITFISFKGYSAETRNSVRISDISSIKTSLSLYKIKNGSYPIPEDSVDYTYDGGVLWRQGDFGKSVVNHLKALSDVPTDPNYALPYTYSVTPDQKEYEVAGILAGKDYYNFYTKKAFANSEGVSTIVDGEYNGVDTVVTGTDSGNIFLLLTPSIIGTEKVGLELKGSSNKYLFSYTNTQNIPANFKGKIETIPDFEFDISGEKIEIWKGKNKPISKKDYLKIAEKVKDILDNNSGLLKIDKLNKFKKDFEKSKTDEEKSFLGKDLIKGGDGKKVTKKDIVCKEGEVLKLDECLKKELLPTYTCSKGVFDSSLKKCKEKLTAVKVSACPSGYTKSGNVCSKSMSTSVTKYCPYGYSDRGSYCEKIYYTSQRNYSCPSGRSLSGSSCKKTTSATKNSCRSGYSLRRNGRCRDSSANMYPQYKTYSEGVSKLSCPGAIREWDGVHWFCHKSSPLSYVPGYHCPSGGSLSGSNCIQTSSASKSCPSGYSGNGSSCRSRTSTSYSKTCPSGRSMSGLSCLKTETLSVSNNCPSGYNDNSGVCEKVLQTSPNISCLEDYSYNQENQKCEIN